jgi:hypothetical protein
MTGRRVVLGALLAIAMSPILAAAQVILTYPRAEETRIFVSPDTVSTWTEVAAQDYLIPNSQVFITGRGSEGTKYLGLLGVAISRSQNESAMGPAADRLRLNFSGELTSALKEAISLRPSTPKFIVADSTGAAMLTLLPSAKLTVSEDNSARLSFRMTVRFVDAITNAEVKKEYYYYHGGGKNLAGPDSWSEDDASSVKKSSEEAMTRLADVLLDDLAGVFSDAYDPAKPRFANYSVVGFEGKQARALLLKEYPDHLALAPLFRDRPSRGVVVILERRSIVLQPM